MEEQKVTPEQLVELKKITKQAEKDIAKVLLRLFLMITFFAITTLLVGFAFVPGSQGFVVLGNALGGIFALVDAIEGSEIVIKKFREEEKKILRGWNP